jgi:uncharacterized protein (TIGR02246 family)
MRWPIVVMGLASIALGCAGSGPLRVAKDKQAIDATRKAYVQAWRAGNAAAVTVLYDDEGMVLYPNTPAVRGKAEILAYFQGFFGEYVQTEFELESDEIEVVGPWAFDRGSYRWKGTPREGGDALEDQGKYLVILRRQAHGSWGVYRDMDNSDRPLAQSTRGED